MSQANLARIIGDSCRTVARVLAVLLVPAAVLGALCGAAVQGFVYGWDLARGIVDEALP